MLDSVTCWTIAWEIHVIVEHVTLSACYYFTHLPEHSHTAKLVFQHEYDAAMHCFDGP